MVKEGYKETEAGVIPEDWECVSLEPYVGIVKSGKRLPKGYLVSQNVTKHPYIRVIDMRMGQLDTKNIMYVPDEAFSAISQYCIYKKDIYISVAGTLGIVGKIPEYLDGANLTENANRITDISCNIDYLLYWLMGDKIQRLIVDSQTLGAQPKLALYQIRSFPIPLPLKEEQNKIAKALSDMDNLISSLEKLIEKKKAIKQGTMQELLTGKKGLYGFVDKRETVRLGDITRVITKGTTPTSIGKYFSDTGINFIKIENISKEGKLDLTNIEHINEETNRFLNRSTLQKDDLVFSIAGALGRIALIEEKHLPANTNQALSIVRVKKNKCNVKYLYYYLQCEKIKKIIQEINVQGAQSNLSLENVANLIIDIPNNIEEQNAIASILSDMDNEIEKLEKKLVKCKKIKQGMMQELLTGKIRLL